MATPQGDSYAVPPGGVISAGRHKINVNAALLGDSLTAPAPNRNTSPFYIANGLNRGVMILLANCGVPSDRVSDVLARIDNSYYAASPGLAGLPSLGRAFLRIGTNDARNNSSAASLNESLNTLMTKLAGYAQKVYILAVPPLGAGSAAYNSLAAGYNDWYAAYASAHPSQFRFIDDCVNIRDGGGNYLADYFEADGVHYNDAGTYQLGLTLGAEMASELSSYADPLLLSLPDPQWHPNPINSGSGDTVTGLSMTNYAAAANYLIVAADGVDSISVPWQRITPTSGGAGSWIKATFSGSNRFMSGSDPMALDSMIQIRLNGVDSTKIGSIMSRVLADTGDNLSLDAPFRIGKETSISQTVTLRHKLRRVGSTTPTAMNIQLYIPIIAAIGAGAGSIDFRCWNVRG